MTPERQLDPEQINTLAWANWANRGLTLKQAESLLCGWWVEYDRADRLTAELERARPVLDAADAWDFETLGSSFVALSDAIEAWREGTKP